MVHTTLHCVGEIILKYKLGLDPSDSFPWRNGEVGESASHGGEGPCALPRDRGFNAPLMIAKTVN